MLCLKKQKKLNCNKNNLNFPKKQHGKIIFICFSIENLKQNQNSKFICKYF